MSIKDGTKKTMRTYLADNYFIPNYQREYAWGENEIEDFWADLESMVNEPTQVVHFFGQIVVHDNDDENEKKYIIDGQQRTITSIIFLRALQLLYHNLYMESGNSLPDANENEVLIRKNFIGKESSGTNAWHLVLDDNNQKFFVEKILCDTPSEKKVKKKAQENMRKAYSYFYNNLLEKIRINDNIEDQVDILDKYFTTFSDKFIVIYVSATKLEEAYTIFETLNTRGKGLETADLLKNYIFSMTKTSSDFNINYAQKKWGEIQDQLDNTDMTKYIRSFWNSCHEFTREKELYRSISRNVQTPKEGKKLLDELLSLSSNYHDICNPYDISCFQDEKLIKCLENLKLLKFQTFHPAILAMLQTPSLKDESSIGSVLKAVEKYAFRNITICKMSGNKAERYFALLSKEIFDEKLSDVDLIIKSIEKETVSDEEFRASLNEWIGSNSKKEIIRYFFRKIHNHLDNNHELNIDNSEVHIEHIMPENISLWSIDPKIHADYLWKLGNLTLLAGKINKEISNKPFEEKREHYLESKIEPNCELANYNCWTELQIMERSEILCKYALDIWSVDKQD